MNRAALHWALQATLAHAGGKAPYVGIANTPDAAHCYATDDYTIGIARLEGNQYAFDGPIACLLSASEARDLARFIKPTRVAHGDEFLQLALTAGELHVATSEESAVFELASEAPDISLATLLGLCSRIMSKPPEWGGMVYQPDLFARFAKAKRFETDRMHVYPRAGEQLGYAVVTVGDDFIGCVAGLTYDGDDDTMESFLGMEA